MFADLHHLHQFISLEQGGSVSTVSNVAGTGAGEADIYFGELLYSLVVDLLIMFSLAYGSCGFPVRSRFSLVECFQVPPT